MVAWYRTLEFIRKTNPDSVVLLGDFLDFYSISRYDKAPGHESLEEELEDGKLRLGELKAVSGKAWMLYLEGNHEQRLTKYLMRKAPELLGLHTSGDLAIPKLLGLDEKRVQWVPWGQSCIVGGVSLEHGDCSRANAGYTAHAMLNKRAVQRGVSAHTHRLAHVFRTVQGRTREWAEAGCLQDRESAGYTLHPDWQYGLVYLREDDQLHLQSFE